MLNMYRNINQSYIFLVCCIIDVLCDFNPSSDNILYSLNWPGPLAESKAKLDTAVLQDENSIFMTTKDNEKYKCVLPVTSDEMSREEMIDAYTGPSEMELIAPLFKQTTCSYRLESYWTYELCHGKFLRQYHEDKELGKKAKIQEYFLGKYVDVRETSEKPNENENPTTADEVSKPPSRKRVPVLKIEGIELAYFDVPFEDGTLCDLTKKPRRASIRYVCQPDGKGEVYEFKEISTCEYALVVLTSALCTHPAYMTKKEPVNEIQCHSLSSSPRRPVSLDNLEMDNTKGQYNRRAAYYFDGQTFTLVTDDDDDDDFDDDDEEDFDDNEDEATVLPKKQEKTFHERVVVDKKVDSPISSATDTQMLTDFLRGEYCIQGGGSGWWKHEFCFGKSVIQYHEEKHGKRSDIILGLWDEEDHINWLKNNPAKAPKSKDGRKHLAFYYGTGDVCDLTGKRRFTEVKLKCKENKQQPHSMSIYLVEPNPCEYLLVVESQIFCDLVLQGDDTNGLLKIP